MKAIPAGWEVVIGLEIHAQLKTASKIFCACPAAYGGEPNSRCCPVCLGMPGALPVLNRRVVELALRAGLALGCRLNPRSVMARKNYFYPDLPKGYQISQFDLPLWEQGHLDIVVAGQSRRIGITRIHIEEDAGKSLHGGPWTLVDLNRCGVPLVEIVSEPELRHPAEAHDYLQRLRQILVYLDVCDGNMEEGSLRCDANVSLRRPGETALGTKTEVKNLNSFRGVEAALEQEITRQHEILERGEAVVQETLLWDTASRRVRPMRGKEDAHDYRYFPEPDLPPLLVDPAWLESIRKALPELPEERRRRFEKALGLGPYEAEVLCADRALADYFESTHAALDDAPQAAKWVMGEVLRRLKERGGDLADFPVDPQTLATLLGRVADGSLSNSAAKTIFEKLVAEGGSIDAWIEKLGLAQVSDLDTLAALVDEILAAHPEECSRYRGGEKKLFGWFVGQLMGRTGGKANPREASRLLREGLDGPAGD